MLPRICHKMGQNYRTLVLDPDPPGPVIRRAKLLVTSCFWLGPIPFKLPLERSATVYVCMRAGFDIQRGEIRGVIRRGFRPVRGQAIRKVEGARIKRTGVSEVNVEGTEVFDDVRRQEGSEDADHLSERSVPQQAAAADAGVPQRPVTAVARRSGRGVHHPPLEPGAGAPGQLVGGGGGAGAKPAAPGPGVLTQAAAPFNSQAMP